MNSTTDNSTLEYQIIGRLLTFPQEMQEALDIGLKKINFSDKDLGNLYEEMADKFLEKGSFDIAIILCVFFNTKKYNYLVY